MAGSADVDETVSSPALTLLIRQDQFAGICRNMRAGLPVNFVIGIVVMLVALHSGKLASGLSWFAASCVINLIRLTQCWLPNLDAPGSGFTNSKGVERSLHPFWITALVSGLIWGFIPVLCNFCTAPQSLFYLTVICGGTAGAISHSAPYARMPICFVVPPLISIMLCLLYAGGFDHNALAATVLVFMLFLVKSALQSEAGFRVASRLKNEAVTLAQSLHEAHSNAVVLASQMTSRAAHDGLTAILNRAGFLQAAETLLTDRKSAFCLMLLDLDGFKSVNDVYGHYAGDRVLVEVARRLTQALSSQFIISRLGGDEFAIFYDTSVVDAFPAEIATRLVTSIEVPFASFDVGRLGACIGVYIGRGRNVAEMLSYADEALYVAKAAGRNRYYIFDEILGERSEMRRDVERDLERALLENAMEVWYQPVFSQQTRQLVGLEALLRWKHPRHGLIPPTEVIRIAAMSGLAEALLRYVFAQVCRVISELSELGLSNVRVAINISPREISKLPIDEMLLSGLRALQLAPSMLEIEITEETALDIRSVQDKLIRLSQSGINIAVDDFGVGYSSLSTLRQTYINKIKIDNSFVRGIAQSPENQILVQAILNLGRSLNVQVVAEGVETVEDLNWLARNEGDLLQGYFLKAPASHKSVLEWLQQEGLPSFH